MKRLPEVFRLVDRLPASSAYPKNLAGISRLILLFRYRSDWRYTVTLSPRLPGTLSPLFRLVARLPVSSACRKTDPRGSGAYSYLTLGASFSSASLGCSPPGIFGPQGPAELAVRRDPSFSSWAGSALPPLV